MTTGPDPGPPDWGTVQATLAARRGDLDTTDLDLLGEATWWLGNAPGAMDVAEEAYLRLQHDGREQAAAEHALRLTLAWALRGDLAVARAWLSRARRVLGDLDPCALHGYLAYVEGSLETDLTGNPEPAGAAAHELDHLAERFDDQALRTLALGLRGMAAVRSGEVEAGWADLDESVLPLLNGRLGALWTGDLLCSVVHLCDQLVDLERTQLWTDVMARWATPLSQTFMYADVVRVHELQLACATGDWELVERELGDRAEDLVGAHGWLAGEGYYTLGEVRRLRGDRDAAEDAYHRARGLGHDAQPGAALLLRSAGRTAEALESLRIGLADQSALPRAGLLLPTIELLLETRRPGVCRRAGHGGRGHRRALRLPGVARARLSLPGRCPPRDRTAGPRCPAAGAGWPDLPGPAAPLPGGPGAREPGARPDGVGRRGARGGRGGHRCRDLPVPRRRTRRGAAGPRRGAGGPHGPGGRGALGRVPRRIEPGHCRAALHQ